MRGEGEGGRSHEGEREEEGEGHELLMPEGRGKVERWGRGREKSERKK